MAAVAIDYFSKWCKELQLSDKKTFIVVHFNYDKIICRHTCPKIKISDKGREFWNYLYDELFKLTEIFHKVTSLYHPQANGFFKRFNRIHHKKLFAQSMKISMYSIIIYPKI